MRATLTVMLIEAIQELLRRSETEAWRERRGRVEPENFQGQERAWVSWMEQEEGGTE